MTDEQYDAMAGAPLIFYDYGSKFAVDHGATTITCAAPCAPLIFEWSDNPAPSRWSQRKGRMLEHVRR